MSNEENPHLKMLKEVLGYKPDEKIDPNHEIKNNEIFNILKTTTVKEAVAFLDALDEHLGIKKERDRGYKTKQENHLNKSENFSYPTNHKAKGSHAKPFFRDGRW